MKKFDFTAILFGLLLSAIAAYFLLRSPPSQSAPSSSIPTVQIGNLIWDQTEMNIGDVKGFAATGFVSAAEKRAEASLMNQVLCKNRAGLGRRPMEFLLVI